MSASPRSSGGGGLGGGAAAGPMVIVAVAAGTIVLICLGTVAAVWHRRRRRRRTALREEAGDGDPLQAEAGGKPAPLPPLGSGKPVDADCMTASPSPASDELLSDESQGDSSGSHVAEPEGKFVGWGSIFAALETGDTKLIKGSWLLNNGDRLVRRQDLPKDAFWELEDLQAHIHHIEVVALSYCWLSDLHPDPKGEHLASIRHLLDMRLESTSARHVHDVALFWDYLSLPQRGPTGEARSAEEEAAFRRGLDSMSLWYGHAQVSVWLHTFVPSDVSRRYDARGWPAFERALGNIVTDGDRMLDFNKVENGCTTWEAALEQCTSTRRPPMSPAAFEAQVRGLEFTDAADRDMVVALYARTFEELLAAAEELWHVDLEWGDAEACELAAVLPHCRCLKTLSLQGNRIGARGAEAVVRAAAALPAVVLLALHANPLEQDEAKKLRELWVALGKPVDTIVLPRVCGATCGTKLVTL